MIFVRLRKPPFFELIFALNKLALRSETVVLCQAQNSQPYRNPFTQN